MQKKLSIIIPSYQREIQLKKSIDSIIEILNFYKFIDYDLLGIVSGVSEFKLEKNEGNVQIYTVNERLYPGIARNIGLDKSNSEWIWFIDDDDEISFENVKILLDLFLDQERNDRTDLICHSLKNSYKQNNHKIDLLQNVCLFKEKQEVFNYIVKSEIIKKNKIVFSDGLHEDIRFVADLIRFSSYIEILDCVLYKKVITENSITKNLNEKRIDGYLLAVDEISKIEDDNFNIISEKIVTQCLGTILYLINQSDEKLKLLEYLEKKFNNNFRSRITEKYDQKNSNFKFACSLFLEKINNDKFLEDLDYCFSSYLSCRDLKNSIFLGPKEIIGCCKRFFYNGKMKGDIVLMPESNDVNLEEILLSKRKVEEGINSETYEPCEGCPYIERYHKSENKKINYISLENFTYCNMRCSYCSPKYYGGKEALYDTYDIIDNLIKGDYLDKKVHVVWGGGEPTIKPKFKEITEKLISTENVYKIRVLTNSLRFSKELYDLTTNDKIRIVTSIDAGSQNVFKSVRGKGEITTVLKNLKSYSDNIKDPENLTLKYILTDQNYFSEELEEFVRLIKEHGFENNFIQISCNFLYDHLDDGVIFSMYELAARLLSSGFKFVFFDDLIRDRLNLDENIVNKVLNHLSERQLLHDDIFHHKTDKKVILWGDGYQSKWIQNNTTFGKSNKIIAVVSNKIDYESLDFNDAVVVPAGIQQITDIFKEIKKEDHIFNSVKFPIFL